MQHNLSELEDRIDYPSSLMICDKVLAHISEKLIAREYKKKILDFSNLLPQSFKFSSFILECPLTEKTNWADISFYVDLSQEHFFQDIPTLPLSWQSCEGWKQLSPFIKDCFEKGFFSGFLFGIYNQIWIEFDVGSSRNYPFRPSFFLNTSKVKNNVLCSTIRVCTPYFKSSGTSLEVLQTLSDLLIEGLAICQIGFMLSRSGNTLRVHIRGNDPHKIAKYISDIGISILSPSMFDLLKKMGPLVDSIGLNLDVAHNQLTSKIGLEFAIAYNCPKREERWSQCFDILRSECKIDTEKQIAIQEWTGQTADYIGNSIYCPYFWFVYSRSISHVKIIYDTESRPTIKIYLHTNLKVLQK